ncbi:filamentous hemagglutinin outer membrane protein [Calothrix sp. NIES-4071]|nr:filamentous hemagglutinin outer membrane protein [Calothrix sp. NIES-4071]BAZ61933.1 filamentous hemagglutinin outer membrane protein [Calothrix sp. NIES-4105]
MKSTNNTFLLHILLRIIKSLALSGLAITFSSNNVLAQISPDETLGAERSVITPNVNIKGAVADQIDGGAIRGSNLFHSFSEFNVKDGQRVYFSNPSGIQNILGRVTGTDLSNILGTLGVNGSANLFLLNPNGIIFGENARLDVRGSFAASTANAIQFGEQGFFSVTNPEAPALLTVNPSALFFNQINTKKIENQSRAEAGLNIAGTPLFGLRVPDGQSLLLLGGEIVIDKGGLHALGGQVELAGVAVGTVGLTVNDNKLNINFPQKIERADISLRNSASVSTSNQGGGNIRLFGKHVTVSDGSRIEANTLGSLVGGDLRVDASEILEVVGESAIGQRSELVARTTGTGNAGNLIITAPVFRILEGARVSTTTNGAGKAGNLTVTASSVQVSGFTKTREFGSDLFAQTRRGSTGDGGELIVTTKRLLVQNGGQIGVSTFGDGNGGRLTINASELVEVSGSSESILAANTNGKGKGGDLIINTGKLVVQDGAEISASTSGDGDAGSLLVNASESVHVRGTSVDGKFTSELTAGAYATGKGGELTINTPLLVLDEGNIFAGTASKGNAGNLRINTNYLIAENGAQISTITVSSGNGGRLVVNASKQVQLNGTSKDGRRTTGLFASTSNTGKAGDLVVDTPVLIVDNGAQISTSTIGEGEGGKLTIKASESVQLRGVGSGLSSQAWRTGNAGSITLSTPNLTIQEQARIAAETISKGNAGNINIDTNKLMIREGGIISSATTNEGNGGKLTVNATESVQVINNPNELGISGLFTQTQGTGKAQTLTINTPVLIVQDGAQIDAGTDVGSTGDGGDLTVNASESVQLIGKTAINKYPSGLFTATRGTGKAGNLSVNSPKLIIRDGATISSATNNGASGNISITANRLETINGGKFRTTTTSINKAGDITLNVKDSILLAGVNSGLFANTEPGSTGDGGNIFIDPRSIILRDGARIAVDSQGSGKGGDIQIQAGALTLDNQAAISAETASNTGGSINLKMQELLLLRRDSKISTNAGTNGAGGDGGNIDINAKFIVAPPKENSDITANAFQGSGGKVTINSAGIFGLKPLSRQELERLLQTTDPTQLNPSQLQTSDITAISQTNPSLNGEINLNTPDTDPSRGIEELPTEIVDASGLVNQNLCVASIGSEFTITGRGGLPASPYGLVSANAAWEDWSILEPYTTKPASTSNSPRSSQKASTTIIEAQGWVTDANGDVILTAKPVKVAPSSSWSHSPNCQTGRAKS